MPRLLYQQSTRLQHHEGHSDAVTVVAFSPDGERLASGGLDGRVCVWSVGSGKLLHVFLGKSSVLSVLWLDSNEYLVCGMEDGTIASLAIHARRLQLTGFLAHRYPVERLVFNGTYLASAAHREVKVWARITNTSWKLEADLPPPRRSSSTKCEIVATSVHWTSGPSRPTVLLITYLSHGVAAFDGRTWARIGGTAVPGRIADAHLTQDGRILAISNMLTGFELFELKGFVELEPLFEFQQDVINGPPIPVHFLHGDHAIIGGTLHGQVNIWDIYSRRKQQLAMGGMLPADSIVLTLR
ncbi:WD40 repeat-like protein [Pilatotrama ljubarskyi]|nr:WD40 repeat-like protein [Pilatotrama ljubarskyi]